MTTFSSLAYLVASVLFILALRGLSHPETAQRGLTYGMVGMGLAIVVTLFAAQVTGWTWIIIGVAIGGSIGTYIAKTIEMTSLPQLMAAFHSLVGLAAVCVAGAAFYNPEAFHIGHYGDIKTASLIEMALGLAIGAVTFTGSIIAWGKLHGKISGKPIVFSGQHKLNAMLGCALVLMIVL
jgi:NAD(P) transhydrogenase subunit beta